MGPSNLRRGSLVARDFVSRIPSRQSQLSNQPAFGGASAEGLAMVKFTRI